MKRIVELLVANPNHLFLDLVNVLLGAIRGVFENLRNQLLLNMKENPLVDDQVLGDLFKKQFDRKYQNGEAKLVLLEI